MLHTLNQIINSSSFPLLRFSFSNQWIITAWVIFWFLTISAFNLRMMMIYWVVTLNIFPWFNCNTILINFAGNSEIKWRWIIQLLYHFLHQFELFALPSNYLAPFIQNFALKLTYLLRIFKCPLRKTNIFL